MWLAAASVGTRARACASGSLIVGVIVGVVAGSSGCVLHAGTSSATFPVAPESHDDRLGVDDLFMVRVYGEPDLSGEFRIAADGTIDFPLAGRIHVQGLDVGGIQREIVQRLKAGYLLNPQVTVMIKEFNSRKVSVLGQVVHPGAVSYFPSMTIVDAIASAGGFTGVAAKNTVNLRREVTGKVETHTFPVADITEGRSPNVTILPGDVLVVEERLF